MNCLILRLHLFSSPESDIKLRSEHARFHREITPPATMEPQIILYDIIINADSEKRQGSSPNPWKGRYEVQFLRRHKLMLHKTSSQLQICTVQDYLGRIRGHPARL